MPAFLPLPPKRVVPLFKLSGLGLKSSRSLGFCALGVLVFVLFESRAWAAAPADPSADQRYPVEVIELRYLPRAKEVRGSGRIAPIAEQSLSFKVPGLLQQVAVEVGQTLRQGDLIARLELEEIEAQLARALSLEADTRRQMERLSQLRQRQLASDEQLQQATTAHRLAEADLRIARFNRQHAEIRAPQAGRVLARHAEPHQLIQAGQAVVELADTSQGWALLLQVADVDVVRLNPGDPALIRLDAYPNQRFDGRIRTLAGKADPDTQTFEVEVVLLQPPHLYAGLIAHATLLPQRTTPLAQLPLTALVHARGHQAELYLLDEADQAQRTAVEIAWIAGDDVLIYPGPREASRVVTRGGSLLYSGASVRPLP